MEVLSRITISCFALSYLLAFIVEFVRLYWRTSYKTFLSTGLLLVGCFTHTCYLVFKAKIDLAGGAPLSSWHAWCLIAAWIVAIVDLLLVLRLTKFVYSLFLLPVTLLLIVCAIWLRNEPSFSPLEARSVWNTIHGTLLLLGTVLVSLGFLAGLMYLLQDYRLKHKLKVWKRLNLPSLEWLDMSAETSLTISSVLLGLGVLSGIVLDLLKQGSGATGIKWTDPVVWTSFVLFLWLVVSLVFHWIYRPARRGRKVAYLVMASFAFLVAELVLVFSIGHGSNTDTTSHSPKAAVGEDSK